MKEPVLPEFESVPIELRFLLQCARVVIGTDNAVPLPSLAQGIADWNLVVDAAVWHRLESMVYRCLEGRPEIEVPEPFMQKLTTLYRANTRRNLLLAGTLVKVLQAFEAEGIPVLPLKGVALAGLLYDDLAMRRSRDLDLLVTPANRAAARSLLQRLGFRQTRLLSQREERLFFRTDNQLLLEHCDNKVLLELHWAYTTMPSLFPLAVEPAATDLVQVTIAGAQLPCLPPTDLIPYLCFHGSGHLWFRMFWLCDLAALSLVKDLDWQQIMTQAIALRQGRATAQGIGLAACLLAAPLPGAVADYLSTDTAARRLIRKNILFYNRPPNQHGVYELPYSTRKHLSWRAGMQASWLLKGRIWGRALCRPQVADLRFFDLPRWLYPLYYLLRPLRLVFKYIRG